MPTYRRMTLVLLIALAGAGVWAPGPAQARPASGGYWLAGADGGVFSYAAPFYGSGVPVPGGPAPCMFTPQPPSTLTASQGCTAIGGVADGSGYWLLNLARQPTPFGGAGFSGADTGCTSLNGAEGTWVGMASSLDGAGYRMVASNGGVMGCGDAPPPYGGLTSETVAAPVVGMAATPDGLGYWLVAADGGVFAFGDAAFVGSLGGTPLNAPIVGMSRTGDGLGYWLVAADGGVFAFGDATFVGSLGGTQLNAPVVGIATAPSGQGYWLAAADGGVFAFGTAPFLGSMAAKPLSAPIVGIAPELAPFIGCPLLFAAC
ncbi:MAG TPA: hypothetical protein VIH95_05445 [Acidimicrobiales bacterium]